MALPPAKRALDRVAQIASAQTNLPVELAAQKDQAFLWGAAAVHPMQALESSFRRFVRAAEEHGGDPARQRERESAALGEYFFFEASSVRLLGVGRDQGFDGAPFPLPGDAMRHARQEWYAAREALAGGGGGAARIDATRRALQHVARPYLPPENPTTTIAPSVAQANPLIGAPGTAPAVLANLKRAIALLGEAVEGDASVQAFYVIEPFYLLRLLVSYRVRSRHQLTDDQVANASGALTATLNRQQWLTDWLAHAMIDLEQVVMNPDVQPHVRFFLKGGRALAYLFGRPQDGANDWDSQVLIDPDLPADEWYAVYRKVSNRLLVALMRKKAEFYSLLNANAAQLIHLPLPIGIAADPFADAAPDPGSLPETPSTQRDLEDEEAPFSRSCKAELIDVGMPRRDTIECREQWVQLAQDIIRPTDGMPIPGFAYYIDEYLTMVREFFAGEPRAQAKAHKRIERLAELMARDGAAIAILNAYEGIPNGILQIAAQPVAAFAASQLAPARQPLHYVLIELLDQFATAYEMELEPLLAAQFAEYLVEWMPQAEALSQHNALARFRLSVDATPMADAIGFGQWLSDRLQAHVAGRAALIATQREAIDALIRALYADSIFDQQSELELQMAIGGSLAAALHAQYEHARGATLEPVGKITIGLYCTDRATDPATAIELVKPLLAPFVDPQPGALFQMDDSHPGRLLLFAANVEIIEPFGPYEPLVIEIVAKRVRVRPLISFIWGFPVLSLRDLILEYQTRAAHVVEFAMRGMLRRTARSLTDMLMKVRQ